MAEETENNNVEEEEEGDDLEDEKKPERAVKKAVAAVEKADAKDPVIGSGLAKESGRFFKDAGKVALAGIGVLILRTVYGLGLFAIEAIKKGGNVGFKGGKDAALKGYGLAAKDKK